MNNKEMEDKLMRFSQQGLLTEMEKYLRAQLREANAVIARAVHMYENEIYCAGDWAQWLADAKARGEK
jgi:hypothetical protein